MTGPTSDEKLRAALQQMVHDTTHSSPCRPNGDHDCTIKAGTLAQAYIALTSLSDDANRLSTAPNDYVPHDEYAAALVALGLADALLEGANMDRTFVRQKVKEALGKPLGLDDASRAVGCACVSEIAPSCEFCSDKPDFVPRSRLVDLESEARRIAAMFAPDSGGRNTFVIFAEKIAEAQQAA